MADELADMLAWQVGILGHKDAIREAKLIPARKFRFDLAYEKQKLAVEVNGGNWIGGRHINPKSIESEYEKINLAAQNGWYVQIYTPKQVKDWSAAEQIKQFLDKS